MDMDELFKQIDEAFDKEHAEQEKLIIKGNYKMQNLKLYTQEEIVNMLFDTTAEMGKQIYDAKGNMDFGTFSKVLATVVRFKSSMLEKLGFSEEEIDELVNKYKEMKNESNT